MSRDLVWYRIRLAPARSGVKLIPYIGVDDEKEDSTLLAKLEPWSALGMNISQRTWPKKLKKKKASSCKPQAASRLDIRCKII